MEPRPNGCICLHALTSQSGKVLQLLTRCTALSHQPQVHEKSSSYQHRCAGTPLSICTHTAEEEPRVCPAPIYLQKSAPAQLCAMSNPLTATCSSPSTQGLALGAPSCSGVQGDLADTGTCFYTLTMNGKTFRAGCWLCLCEVWHPQSCSSEPLTEQLCPGLYNTCLVSNHVRRCLQGAMTTYNSFIILFLINMPAFIN